MRPDDSRDWPRTSLVLILAGWIGLWVWATLGVEAAWQALQDAPRGPRPSVAWLDALAPLASMVVGLYSMLGGGPLLLLTWLAVPRRVHRTLPWLVGTWAVITFAALCGALQFVAWTPEVNLGLLALLWVCLAEGVRIVVTALVHLSTLPEAPTRAAGADV